MRSHVPHPVLALVPSTTLHPQQGTRKSETAPRRAWERQRIGYLVLHSWSLAWGRLTGDSPGAGGGATHRVSRKQEGATATRENLLGQKSGRLQATKNFKKHTARDRRAHTCTHTPQPASSGHLGGAGGSLSKGPLELATAVGLVPQREPEGLTCLNPKNPRWGILFTPQIPALPHQS